MKNLIAKIIRVVSVPPVLVFVLLAVVFFHGEYAITVSELIVSACFLALIPALAYPVQILIPAFRKKGREGQRNLAFLFTIGGYAAGLIYAFLFQIGKELTEIFVCYLLSCVVLIVFNKLIGRRASGHAAGTTGALLFLVRFTGWCFAPVSLAVYAASFWASLRLGRHTCSEFALGTLTSLVAFFAGIFLCRFLPV